MLTDKYDREWTVTLVGNQDLYVNGSLSVSLPTGTNEYLSTMAVEALVPEGWEPPQIPAQISNFQCRAVLNEMPSPVPGHTLLTDVNTAVAAIGGMTALAWEYANDISRNGATVTSLAPAFSLSDAALNMMFLRGAQIEA